MVVDRQPFAQTARVVAWLLAALCVTSGGAGVVLAIVHAHLRLALAAAGILALGAFYAGAAWRGRPWHWR